MKLAVPYSAMWRVFVTLAIVHDRGDHHENDDLEFSASFFPAIVALFVLAEKVRLGTKIEENKVPLCKIVTARTHKGMPLSVTSFNFMDLRAKKKLRRCLCGTIRTNQDLN
jgi:hypothetical protein